MLLPLLQNLLLGGGATPAPDTAERRRTAQEWRQAQENARRSFATDALPPVFQKIAAFDPVIAKTLQATRRVPVEAQATPAIVARLGGFDPVISQTLSAPRRVPLEAYVPPRISFLGGVDPVTAQTLPAPRRVPVFADATPPIVRAIGAFDPTIVPTRPAPRIVPFQPDAPPAVAVNPNPILGLAFLHFYVDKAIAAPAHSGADVTSWADLSVLGNNLDQVTANKPQLLANGGVQFLAANSTGIAHQAANSIGTGAYVIGLVFKLDAVIDNEVIFGDADLAIAGVTVKINTTSLSVEHYGVGLAARDDTDVPFDTGSYHIVIISRAVGAAPIIYRDNVNVTGFSSTADPIASGTGSTSGIAMGQFGNFDSSHSSVTFFAAFIVGGASIDSTKATEIYNFWYQELLSTPIVSITVAAPNPQPTRRYPSLTDALPGFGLAAVGGLDLSWAAPFMALRRAVQPAQAEALPPVGAEGGFDPVIVVTLPAVRRVPALAEATPPIVVRIAAFDPVIVQTRPAVPRTPALAEGTPPINSPRGGFDALIVPTLLPARRVSTAAEGTPPIVFHVAGFDPVTVATLPPARRVSTSAEGTPPIVISVGGLDFFVRPAALTVRRAIASDAFPGVPAPWLSDVPSFFRPPSIQASPRTASADATHGARAVAGVDPSSAALPRPNYARPPALAEGIPPIVLYIAGFDPVIVPTLPAPRRVPTQADATPPVLTHFGGLDTYLAPLLVTTRRPATAEAFPALPAPWWADLAQPVPRPALYRVPSAAEGTPPIVVRVAVFDPVIAATLPAAKRTPWQTEAPTPIFAHIAAFDPARAVPQPWPVRPPSASDALPGVIASTITAWFDPVSPARVPVIVRRSNASDALPAVAFTALVSFAPELARGPFPLPRRQEPAPDTLPRVGAIGGFDPTLPALRWKGWPDRRPALSEAFPAAARPWAPDVQALKARTPAPTGRPSEAGVPLPAGIHAAFTPEQAGQAPPAGTRARKTAATDAMPGAPLPGVGGWESVSSLLRRFAPLSPALRPAYLEALPPYVFPVFAWTPDPALPRGPYTAPLRSFETFGFVGLSEHDVHGTPAGRIIRVAPDGRVIMVAFDDRSLTASADMRSIRIVSDDRVLWIPRDPKNIRFPDE